MPRCGKPVPVLRDNVIAADQEHCAAEFYAQQSAERTN